MTTNETRYLTVAEAAARLRVSRPTVWRWIDSGRLRAYRIGARSIRIREEDIERVVAPVTEAKRHSDDSDRHGRPPVAREDVLRRLRRMHADQLARRGGRPLPSSVPLIREAREER